MAFTQQTFYNASIRGFNANLGWGNQSSSLSVDLVNDPSNLDDFDPPIVGSPSYFTYDGWTFGGVLQSSKVLRGSDGNPVFQVILEDPRAVLEGVNLILNGYDGSTEGVPNVLNVYGKLESVSFGNSQVNETGMPWKKVRDTAQALINSPDATYGGPISLRGFVFKINLDALPPVPDNYRIGGEFISLMDFIAEVCSAASHDFFFTLVNTGLDNYITLNTISRASNPAFGLISNFVSALSVPPIRTEIGFELRNETTGKFVVGGNKQELYFQPYSAGSPGTYTDDTIWPFWGQKQTGEVIIGEDINNDHHMRLRSEQLNVPGLTGVTYWTNVWELRAALESRESWEGFLWLRNDDGTVSTNPQFGRASAVNLTGQVHKNLKAIINGDKPLVPAKLGPTAKPQLDESADSISDDHEEALDRLYQFVLGYAQEFYGRKFMVRIPSVRSKREPETDRIIHDLEPVDSAYLAESLPLATAISANLVPNFINPLTTQDGKFETYVRFDSISDLDFSDVPPDSIVFNSTATSAFVKAEVDPYVYFVNVSSLTNPRVVITLPGVVRKRIGDLSTKYAGVLLEFLDQSVEDGNITEDAAIKFKNAFGMDNLNIGVDGLAILPNLAVVPLRKNKETYGPWKVVGGNGKSEFEKDETLVPWNYGGYAQLNIAANAKVLTAFSNMQVSEHGLVEIAGVPSLNLGSQLIAGGPYVTDVSVSISESQVTSTYRMNTWTPDFGRIRKAEVDRMERLHKVSQQSRRFMRDRLFEDKRKNQVAGAIGAAKREKTARRASRSTHNMIVGENIGHSGDLYSNVGVQPVWLTTSQIGGDQYQYKAGMSMDGMFRPYSTWTDAPPGFPLPKFVTAADGATTPTVDDLNPFASGHDISVVLRGTEFPSDLETIDGGYDPSGNYRGLALKGPVVICGYGYDISGKPVPNDSEDGSSDEFLDGYLGKPDTWKVGPLATSWDEDRGVWVAGGGNEIFKAVTTTDMCDGGNGSGRLSYNSEDVAISNFMSSPISSGVNILLWRNPRNLDEYIPIEYALGRTTQSVVTSVECTNSGLLITNDNITVLSCT